MKQYDVAAWVRLYLSGVSILDLRYKYKVSERTIARELDNVGVMRRKKTGIDSYKFTAARMEKGRGR